MQRTLKTLTSLAAPLALAILGIAGCGGADGDRTRRIDSAPAKAQPDSAATPTLEALVPATVAIDWYDVHQEIDGFGVAQGEDYSPYLKSWPEPQRTEMLDLAFSPQKGIGLSLLRSQVPVGPWGTEHPWPSLEPEKGVWNHNDEAQVWLMHEATNRGPVKLMASVWSPPDWMKTTGSNTSGSLATSHYQDYADYLAHYADEYAKANNVQIHAISMANEPTTDGTGWPTCTWTGSQFSTFLSQNLAPTFANRGLTTKIIAPETSNWDEADGFLATIARNSAAMNRVDIAAAHLYGGDAAKPMANTAGKKVWQTEGSERFDPWTYDGALDWAKTIHEQLTEAEVNAWFWWILFHWREGGSVMANVAPDGSFDGRQYSVSKAFWALGHFSKFVRPGFVRIGAVPTGTADVYASAYKNPVDGQLVVVLVNKGNTGYGVKLAVDGFTTDKMTPYVTTEAADQNLRKRADVPFNGAFTVGARSMVTLVSHASVINAAARAPGSVGVVGKFNAGKAKDLAIVGAEGFGSVPTALSRGDGSFKVKNAPSADFGAWAATPNVTKLSGDFDHDGLTDIALIGGDPAWWTTMPVAFSKGDGTFRVTNSDVGDFADWAAVPGVSALAGDFDGDGRTDVALIGGDPAWWHTMPVAFSKGDGSFRITNVDVGEFAAWAAVPNVKRLVGDFDRDGRADVALIGGDPAWWHTMPVAFSKGDGSFRVTNVDVGDFAAWATVPNVQLITGDFNNDKRTDVALIGGDPAWWHTMPVAFSNGDGSFGITNADIGAFNAWAAQPNVSVLSGDFDGDGRTDVALTGGDPSWWTTMPVAFSNGNGTFRTTYAGVGDFAKWAGAPGVKRYAGDFNGDGKADVMLLGGDPAWWYTSPVAFSRGDGNFDITNARAD